MKLKAKLQDNHKLYRQDGSQKYVADMEKMT